MKQITDKNIPHVYEIKSLYECRDVADFRAVSKVKKGKVVPVIHLTEHHAVKAYWGEWRYSSTHSLTSAIDGGEWSASLSE
jgi:hypothetical protein